VIVGVKYGGERENLESGSKINLVDGTYLRPATLLGFER
jgi:hypothetical protein